MIMQGIDIKEMLAGAALMDEETRTPVVSSLDCHAHYTIAVLIFFWKINHAIYCNLTINHHTYSFCSCDPPLQLKNNPAALLAMCWYWATDGVGSKVFIVPWCMCDLKNWRHIVQFYELLISSLPFCFHLCRIWLYFHTRTVYCFLAGICNS